MGNVRPLDQQTLEEAKSQQLEATLKGIGISLLPVLPVAIQRNPRPYGATVTQLWSGFHFEPTQTRTIPKIGGAALLTYLLPAPFGVVPPEIMGVNPDYIHNEIGSVPGEKTVGFKAQEARLTAFQARQRQAKIEEYLLEGAVGARPLPPTPQLLSDYFFLKHSATEPKVGRDELSFQQAAREQLLSAGVNPEGVIAEWKMRTPAEVTETEIEFAIANDDNQFLQRLAATNPPDP